jgi:hypothetical protein
VPAATRGPPSVEGRRRMPVSDRTRCPTSAVDVSTGRDSDGGRQGQNQSRTKRRDSHIRSLRGRPVAGSGPGRNTKMVAAFSAEKAATESFRQFDALAAYFVNCGSLAVYFDGSFSKAAGQPSQQK